MSAKGIALSAKRGSKQVKSQEGMLEYRKVGIMGKTRQLDEILWFSLAQHSIIPVFQETLVFFFCLDGKLLNLCEAM